MRVITLQEPWASLIGENIKTIETRSWPCRKYGELYIHASSLKIPTADQRKNELASWLEGSLHYGTIFLKCVLSDCVLITEEFSTQVKESNIRCFLSGDYSVGRYAWVLTNIEFIDPIVAKGKLGIWYFNK